MTTTKQVGWLAVLNALAGTTNLGAEAAANIYAGLPANNGLGVLGALNVKAGYGRSPAGWQGLDEVCNKIAGTNGLEALQALQIHAGLT